MAEEIDKYEDDIDKLIDTGKEKGYLTYGEVNDLLPGAFGGIVPVGHGTPSRPFVVGFVGFYFQPKRLSHSVGSCDCDLGVRTLGT